MDDFSLDSLSAEDVISQTHLETYRKEHETIYNQLISVKNNLFVIERIVGFPFDLFTNLTRTVFWNLTSKAFFDSTVLALDTLVAEKKQRFALPVFRKKVVEKYLRRDIDPSLLSQLQKEIDKVNFDTRISTVREKIGSVRNHHIAHLDPNTKLGRDTTVHYGIALDELQEAVRIAHELFAALSFGAYPMLDLIEYYIGDGKSETDIDDLLTFVASRSSKIFRFGTPSQKERARARFAKLPDDQKQLVEYWQNRVDNLFGQG